MTEVFKHPVKVSVCVVTYNQGSFIRKCLQSIVEQETNFKFEVVVGDDFSQDDSRQIILEFENKYPGIIRTIFHKENIGGQNNFASIIDSCRGDYIAYIDGDDVMLAGKLQKQVDILDNNPNISTVVHDMRVFDSDSGSTIKYFNDAYKQKITTVEQLVKLGTFFCHSSKMHRRSFGVMDQVDLNTKYIGDFLYHIQNAMSGDVYFIDEVLGEYRHHSKSASKINSTRIDSCIADLEYTLNKAKTYGISIESIDYRLTRIYYQYSWTSLNAGAASSFRKYIEKSYKGHYVDKFHFVLYRLRHFFSLLRLLLRIKRYFKT